MVVGFIMGLILIAYMCGVSLMILGLVFYPRPDRISKILILVVLLVVLGMGCDWIIHKWNHILEVSI